MLPFHILSLLGLGRPLQRRPQDLIHLRSCNQLPLVVVPASTSVCMLHTTTLLQGRKMKHHHLQEPRRMHHTMHWSEMP